MLKKIKYSDLFLVFLLCLVYLILPLYFNGFDSICYIERRYNNHYPFLYNCITYEINRVNSSYIWIQTIIQYIILYGSIWYSARIFREKFRIKYYILFTTVNFYIFQLNKGIYSESLYSSFMLINITSSLMLFNRFEIKPLIVFVLSLYLIQNTRFIGLLAFVFPAAFYFYSFISKHDYTKLIKLIVILFLSCISILLSNISEQLIARYYYYETISTYGRPGTYRIVETLTKLNKEERANFEKKWMALSQTPQDSLAKEVIINSKSYDCWLPIYKRIKTDALFCSNNEGDCTPVDVALNRAFQHYLLCLNWSAYKTQSEDLLTNFFSIFLDGWGATDVVEIGNEFTKKNLPESRWATLANETNSIVLFIFSNLGLISFIYLSVKIIRSKRSFVFNRIIIANFCFLIIQIIITTMCTIHLYRYSLMISFSFNLIFLMLYFKIKNEETNYI